MITVFVLLLFISTFFQCYISIKMTRDWANPVVLFCGIHLLHNWITSLFYCLDDSYALGGVLIDITDDMIAANLLRNLIGLWVFFAVFFLLKRWWSGEKASKSLWVLPREKSLLPFFILYFLFSAIVILAGGREGASGQALTADAAFSGVIGILGVRSFFWIFSLVYSGFRKDFRFLLITLPIETILAGGARKVLLMGLLVWLFAFFFTKIKSINRQGLILLAKKMMAMLIPAYFLLYFMAARRDAIGYGIGLGDALLRRLENNLENPIRFLDPLCSTDSESVQIWCSELIANGSLPLMYGKTYIQSFTNMFVLRPFQGEMVNWQAAYVFKSVAYPTMTNHGWDFTFVAESLLNWGNSFFFISFAAYSFLLTWLYKMRDTSLFWQSLYFVFISICFVTFRTDSTSMLRFLSYFLAVALFARVIHCGRGVFVQSSSASV